MRHGRLKGQGKQGQWTTPVVWNDGHVENLATAHEKNLTGGEYYADMTVPAKRSPWKMERYEKAMVQHRRVILTRDKWKGEGKGLDRKDYIGVFDIKDLRVEGYVFRFRLGRQYRPMKEAVEEIRLDGYVRYQVLKESGGKCALCGATSKDVALHVDHIQPRSRQGSNDRANLQVLCRACNLGKSNRDNTDFRSWHTESPEAASDLVAA
jgi:5-methylcytosine-specific restriction endonuclease McrA